MTQQEHEQLARVWLPFDLFGLAISVAAGCWIAWRGVAWGAALAGLVAGLFLCDVVVALMGGRRVWTP